MSNTESSNRNNTLQPDAPSGNITSAARRSLPWLDYLKAIALLWIFLNHISEQLFSYPFIANPTPGWPPLADRINQLAPFSGYGLLDIPLNILRYVGWFGDQGVQLFIIISGFGLTWGLLSRQPDKPLSLPNFFRRRASRVYPLWWAVHLLVLPLILLLPLSLGTIDRNFVLSLLGFRLTSATLYYLVPAWWYIGLLIQLYLIYPLLWNGLRRYGPFKLLIFAGGVALVIRGLGLFVFNDYLDAWNRGAIFITRLPEFVFGISLAAWFHASYEKMDIRLRAPRTFILAVGAYIVGNLLALTLLGMTIAPFLVGMAAFLILYAFVGSKNPEKPQSKPAQGFAWVGEHSYSLYLLHHLVILILIPAGIAPNSKRAWLGILLAILGTLVAGILLERATNFVQSAINSSYKHHGLVGVGLRVGVVLVLIAGGFFGLEYLVRQNAPQEVYGWGERPSLEPDPVFGWRLIPNQTTRLRWETYDYVVTANSLGFPGPEYPPEKSPDTLRIFTIGDAFTSAEGINTDEAWPRLLEQNLKQALPDQTVQVMNFGITGYGPNQYAAVLAQYVPVYEPDLIIIGFFVNDYQDVLLSNEDFQHSIGFNQSPQDGLKSWLYLMNLRGFITLNIWEPLTEIWSGNPRGHGYFLGNFRALERNNDTILNEGVPLVQQRMEEIRETANSVDAPVAVMMIPAPVQVCSADDLGYYPRHVDLTDETRFDLELPQRLTRELADADGFTFYDLLPVLQTDDCVYFPYNMHWKAEGHRIAADFLTDQLMNEALVSLDGRSN